MTALKSKHPVASQTISSATLATGSVLGVLSATPQFLHTKRFFCALCSQTQLLQLSHTRQFFQLTYGTSSSMNRHRSKYHCFRSLYFG